MPPDLSKYAVFLESFDLSEAQKAELVRTVWQIMEGFVDRAFGIHPVQQVGGLVPHSRFSLPGGTVQCGPHPMAIEFEAAASSIGGESDRE